MTLSQPILDAVDAVVAANANAPVPPDVYRESLIAEVQSLLDDGKNEGYVLSQLQKMKSEQ